jgi:hypothetical protein
MIEARRGLCHENLRVVPRERDHQFTLFPRRRRHNARVLE